MNDGYAIVILWAAMIFTLLFVYTRDYFKKK
jgi:hypothetical protein